MKEENEYWSKQNFPGIKRSLKINHKEQRNLLAMITKTVDKSEELNLQSTFLQSKKKILIHKNNLFQSLENLSFQSPKIAKFMQMYKICRFWLDD